MWANNILMDSEIFCLIAFVIVVILGAALWFGPFDLSIDEEEEY